MPDDQPGLTEMTEENAHVSSHPQRKHRRGGGGLRSATRNLPREGRVQVEDKEEKPAMEAELPLKKGGDRIEASSARFWEEDLRDLLERDPEHFRALRAIVEGRPDEASPQHCRDLREWAYLSRDGSPHPKVKAVLLAAVRDTLDGPAIVDPLDVSRPEDAATLRQAEKKRAESLREGEKRIWRDIQRLGDDPDQGLGR
jgi:hypothetical protein